MQRKRDEEYARRVDALSRVDVFRALDAEKIDRLSRRLRHVVFGPGEIILRQGDPGDSLYVVRGGQVAVQIGVLGASKEIATLGDGQFFGEMSLMTGESRTATVVAKTDVECYIVDKEAFQEIVQEKPELAGIDQRHPVAPPGRPGREADDDAGARAPPRRTSCARRSPRSSASAASPEARPIPRPAERERVRERGALRTVTERPHVDRGHAGAAGGLEADVGVLVDGAGRRGRRRCGGPPPGTRRARACGGRCPRRRRWRRTSRRCRAPRAYASTSRRTLPDAIASGPCLRWLARDARSRPRSAGRRRRPPGCRSTSAPSRARSACGIQGQPSLSDQHRGDLRGRDAAQRIEAGLRKRRGRGGAAISVQATKCDGMVSTSVPSRSKMKPRLGSDMPGDVRLVRSAVPSCPTCHNTFPAGTNVCPRDGAQLMTTGAGTQAGLVMAATVPGMPTPPPSSASLRVRASRSASAPLTATNPQEEAKFDSLVGRGAGRPLRGRAPHRRGRHGRGLRGADTPSSASASR